MRNAKQNRISVILVEFMCRFRFSVNRRLCVSIALASIAFVFVATLPQTTLAESIPLDDSCVVSVLNLSSQVAPDGSWQIDNISTRAGQFRVRASCVRDGATISARTNVVSVTPNQVTEVGEFFLVEDDVVPVSLEFSSGSRTFLYGQNTLFPVRVFANYRDGSRVDVTAQETGINYSISSQTIARISASGVLQSQNSGQVMVTASLDGAVTAMNVTIITTGDSDEDGLPDDFEQANGLDPNDAADASEDLDGDGLTNLEEFFQGTQLTNIDSDEDRLTDLEELFPGDEGFTTNPLLADSDGDGVGDGLEIQTGTDPLDATSVDLTSALSIVRVTPKEATLTFNSVRGENSKIQLQVQGETLDGAPINLTSQASGTTYVSSELTTCNFGGQSGEVFAGTPGNCTVTVGNSGFSDTAELEVKAFDPLPLSFFSLGFTGNGIIIRDTLGYVASDRGLEIVDISDPMAVTVVNTVQVDQGLNDLVFFQNQVLAVGASASLVVFTLDEQGFISSQKSANFGSLVDIEATGHSIYLLTDLGAIKVASIRDGEIFDTNTVFLGEQPLRQISIDQSGDYFAGIDATGMVQLQDVGSGLIEVGGRVDLSVGSGLLVEGNRAYMGSSGLRVVDLTDFSGPELLHSVSSDTVGSPTAFALSSDLLFMTEILYANGIPVYNLGLGLNGAVTDFIDFVELRPGRFAGRALAVDGSYIYSLHGNQFQVAQYQSFSDTAGQNPTVFLEPLPTNEIVVEGSNQKVIAVAEDDLAVAAVEFFVDGVLAIRDTSIPFEGYLSMPRGLATTEVTAIATDHGGNRSDIASLIIPLVPDSDGDGLSDASEQTLHSTSAFEYDTDFDGLSDYTEILKGLNPLNADIDADGLLDGEEILRGQDGYITNPFDPDSDNDGMPDGFESRYGLNPIDPVDGNQDLDGDGVSNLQEFRDGSDPTSADSDGDGMSDEFEIQYGLDPFNSDDGFADLDNDGVPNITEFLEGTDPSNPDVTGPAVDYVYRINDLDIHMSLMVRLTEPVKQDAMNDVQMDLAPVNASFESVSGVMRISNDGRILVFDPALALESGVEYEFQVSGIRDLAGNPMAFEYSVEFTSIDAGGRTRPELIGSSPKSYAEDVPVNSAFEFHYDQVMDPTKTEYQRNLKVIDYLTQEEVAGQFSLSEDGFSIRFYPETVWAVGRYFHMSLPSFYGVNGLHCRCANPTTIFMTTSFEADMVPPQIDVSSFPDGFTQVPPNMRFRTRWSEALQQFNSRSITLRSNDTPVAFNSELNAARDEIVVTPVEPLQEGATYELMFSQMQDLAGNEADNHTYEFSVMAPTAIGSVSANNRISTSSGLLPTNIQLSFTASRPLDPTTMDRFVITDETELSRPVLGSWVTDASQMEWRFLPDEPLKSFHDYKWSAYFYYRSYTGVEDLAGNAPVYVSGAFTIGDFVDEDIPKLTNATISDSQLDVPIDLQKFEFEFDETLSRFCTPAAQLIGGAAPVDLEFKGFYRNIIWFENKVSLESQTSYTISITSVCDAAGNDVAQLNVLSFTTGDAIISERGPILVSTVPANGATDISVTDPIILTFDQPLDGLRNDLNVTVSGSTPVGDVRVEGSSISFTPTVPLLGSSLYRVSMSPSAKNLNGVGGGYLNFTFTTQAYGDTEPPQVVAVSPVDQSTAVSPKATLRMTFSEPVQSVRSQTLGLLVNGEIYPTGSISVSADRMSYTIAPSLPENALVSLVFTDGIQDYTGNSLEASIVSFTTGVINTDIVQPTVVQQRPLRGSVAPVNTQEVTLFFSEKMSAEETLEAFLVSVDGLIVAGEKVLLDDLQTVSFKAEVPFPPGSLVQVFARDQILDLSGNVGRYNYSGYFTVEIQESLIGEKPKVISVSPQHGAVEVPLNPLLTLVYNEPLNQAAIGSFNVTLLNSTTRETIPVDISPGPNTSTLFVQPTITLDANQQYSGVVSNVADDDGDTQTAAFGFAFKTGQFVQSDDRAPVALAVSPFNGVSQVGVNSVFWVRFSEPMNPLLISDELLVDVQWSEDYHVLRYGLPGVLPSSTEVDSPLPVFMDLAGNAMSPIERRFTTSEGPDFEAPTATPMIPSGAIVPPNTPIGFTFNEPIDLVSINTDEVYLEDQTLRSAVPGHLDIGQDGLSIRFVPDESLAVGRSFKMYYTGVRDLGGNRVPGVRYYGYGSSFTTEFLPDNEPPVVVTHSLDGLETAPPMNVVLKFKFNEVVDASILDHVQLWQGGTPIDLVASLSDSNQLLTVRSHALLQGNTQYQLMLNSFVDSAGNASVEPYILDFTTGDSVDLVSPVHVQFSPSVNNLQDAPLNIRISMTYAEPIDPTSISPEHWVLTDVAANTTVKSNLIFSNNNTTFTLEPEALLAPFTSYKLTYTAGQNPFTDLAGIQGGVVGRNFTTGDQVLNAEVSQIQEGVFSISEGAENIPLNSELIMTFPMIVSSACNGQAQLAYFNGEQQVLQNLQIQVSNGHSQVQFNYDSSLQASTDYTLSIAGLCDMAGNEIEPLAVQFSTSDSELVQYLSITNTIPASNAEDVPLNSPIEITYSHPIQRHSELNVNSGGNSIAGESEVIGNKIIFTPVSPFPGNQLISVSSSRVSNYAGRGIYRHTALTFTTEEGADEVSPTLVGSSPEHNAVEVLPNTTVLLQFSEPVQTSSVSRGVRIYSEGVLYSKQLQFSADGREVKLVFNPPAGQLFDIVLGEEIMDFAGNAFVQQALQFTTSTVSDAAEVPYVVQAYPSHGTQDLRDVQYVRVTMTEDIDPESLETGFYVSENGQLAVGEKTLLEDQRTLQFKKEALFEAGALVQFFVNQDLKSTQGIHASYRYVRQFTVANEVEAIGFKPVVEVVSISNYAVDVPLNPVIELKFNEELSAEALEQESIHLRLYGTAENVEGTLSLVSRHGGSNNTIRFEPTNALAVEQRYRFTLSGLSDTDGDVSGTVTTDFTTGTVLDDKPPKIEVASPPAMPTDGSSDADVGINALFQLAFDEPINPLSVDVQGKVELSFSADRTRVYYRLSDGLTPGEVFQGLVESVEDIAGVSMTPYAWQFPVSTSLDMDAPIATGSLSGSYNMGTDAAIFWSFNEAIDPASITDNSARLQDYFTKEFIPVSLELSETGRELYLYPQEPLAVRRTYQYYLDAAQDVSGNSARATVKSFRTGFFEDVAPPVVVASTLDAASIALPINGRFWFNFDEPIHPLADVQMTLQGAGAAVPLLHTWSSDRTQLRVVPAQLMQPAASYEFSISGIKDLSNNSAAPVVKTFVTGPSDDVTNGRRDAWSIVENARDIPQNSQYVASFSEAIDPASLSDDSLEFMDETTGIVVPGRYELNATLTAIEFVPDRVLAADHSYAWFINLNTFNGYNWLVDFAGNEIRSRHVLRFDTGASLDTAAPEIKQFSVAENAEEVALNTSLRVEFNEPLSGQCALAATASGVAEGQASVTSVIDILVELADDGLSAALVPSELLEPDTAYSISLHNACDFVGNDASFESVVTFVTAASAEVDEIAPVLISSTPVSGDIDVSINTDILLEFDQPISPLFDLEVRGRNLVEGTVEVEDNQILFQPLYPLASEQVYQVTLANLQDEVGNSADQIAFSFTTVIQADVTPPTLEFMAPGENTMNVNPEGTVRLTFSEPMAFNSDSLAHGIAFYVNGEIVKPTIEVSPNARTLNLAVSLPGESIINVILTDELEDFAGNSLEPRVLSFTTGELSIQNERPRIQRQLPSYGEVGLESASSIILYANQSLSLEGLEPGFFVSVNGQLVEGQLSILSDKLTIVFDPAIPFARGDLVEVFIDDIAMAASGQYFYNYQSYFQLLESEETQLGEPPIVLRSSPWYWMREVPLNPRIVTYWSEPLSETDLDTFEVRLVDGGMEVPVSLSLDTTQRLLEIIPQQLLNVETNYAVHYDRIVDAQGDVQTAQRSFYFATGTDSVMDDRPPQIVTHLPNGTEPVSRLTNYSVYTDEPVNAATFSLLNPDLTNLWFSADYSQARYGRQGLLPASQAAQLELPVFEDIAGNMSAEGQVEVMTLDIIDITPPEIQGACVGLPAGMIGVQVSEVIDLDLTLARVGFGSHIRNRLVGEFSLDLELGCLVFESSSITDTDRSYYWALPLIRDLTGNRTTFHGFVDHNAPDDTFYEPPQLISQTFPSGTNDVPINMQFSYKFNQSMSSDRLQWQLVDSRNQPQDVSVWHSGLSLFLKPMQLLQPNEQYQLILDSVTNFRGVEYPEREVVSFTTNTDVLLRQGRYAGTNLPSGGERVPADFELTVSFDTPIANVTGAVRIYKWIGNSGSTVESELLHSSDLKSFTIRPFDPLEPGGRYQLSMSAMTDFSGQAIYIWNSHRNQYFYVEE